MYTCTHKAEHSLVMNCRYKTRKWSHIERQCWSPCWGTHDTHRHTHTHIHTQAHTHRHTHTHTDAHTDAHTDCSHHTPLFLLPQVIPVVQAQQVSPSQTHQKPHSSSPLTSTALCTRVSSLPSLPIVIAATDQWETESTNHGDFTGDVPLCPQTK